MTTIDIVVPAEQREGTKSTLGRWLKNVGDQVRADEPIAEIFTDKVTLEVAAPASGKLIEILRKQDDEISLAEPLGRIEVQDGVPSTMKNKAAQKQSRENIAPAAEPQNLSPAVRSLAKEFGVSLGEIRGTGKDGRITARDVENAAGKKPEMAPGRSNSKSTRRAHSPMRKKIAQQMVESVTKAPHVTALFEMDFGAALEHKASHEKEFKGKGVKLSLSAYVVQAAAVALRAVPEVNSRWHDDALEIFNDINIGIAAALEEAQGGGAGLIVPVIKNADKLSLFDIAKELETVISRARSGKATAEDLRDATFTISNHGMGGSLLAAPIIIPPPQVAILGIGKVERRPTVQIVKGKEQIVLRSRAFVTLTIDHRALDGFKANEYLRAFDAALSKPGYHKG